MLEWFKNISKDYPDFWKEYLNSFQKKSERYVIISLDKTGLSATNDVILSIGAIAVENDFIVVKDAYEVIIMQYIYLHDNNLPNEYIFESKLPKLTEYDALEAFVNYIKNAVLVGHRIHFDIEIINEALHKMNCGKIKNEALDLEIMHQKIYDEIHKPFTLDELMHSYKIPKIENSTSLDDAYSMALLFLKLKSKITL